MTLIRPGLLCLWYCLWTLCIGVAGGEDPLDWDAVCAFTYPAAAALPPRDHIRIYHMCIRLRPFDIEARMGLAEQLAFTGDTASSAHVLHGVLALPVNAAAALDAHNALGVIMDTQDRAQQAERHLRAALTINPAYTPALTNLGNCLWKQRRAQDAIALYDLAVRLEPFDAGHHYSLAAAQFEVGQPTTAAAGFKRALSLSPSNAPSLLGLGHALRDLQDPSAAAAAYAAAFDIMAAGGGTQGGSVPARAQASPGKPGDAAGQAEGAVQCAVGPAAMQAKLLEFSARLAAGDHCHMPVDMARACLLAASARTISAPYASSQTFIGDLGEEVVWANMYDVAQLVEPDVIKRLAIARGSALEQQAARLLLRHAWIPAPPPSPLLKTRTRAWLDVVLLSSSLDGDHYVTHAVLNLVNALYAPKAYRSAESARVRVHVVSTAKFAAHPPHAAAEAPGREHRHWGCSEEGAGSGVDGSDEWTRSCVMARLASAVEERGGSAVQAHAWSDLDIAMYINSKVRGHVLFHLDGYARSAPVGVAAARPTPVAVLWLGYTGTLGMRSSVTHTLVDRVLVPPEYAPHLSEKSVLLPGSLSALIMRNYTALLQRPPFLPAPCPPPRSTASPTLPAAAAGCQGSEADDRLCQHIVAGSQRAGFSPGESGAQGLNRSRVVAANFNSLYKIGARSVRLWSEALRCISNKTCVPRQMWIARRPGVAADRIAAALQAQAVPGCPLNSGREAGGGDVQVVASEMSGAHEHVRVKSCADLFIDSLEVGAHSTAADALAAGLPVLTTAGSAVSQRVAASLLRAGALLHTLARNPDDMLEVARHLVASKQRLRALRVNLSRLSRQHLHPSVLGRPGRGRGDNQGAAEGGGHSGSGYADGGRELWDAHVWAQAFLRLVALLWETCETRHAYAVDAPARRQELHVIGATHASIHGHGR